MRDANALLRAIHARLSGDAGLVALIGPDGLRDRLLPRQTLPAIVFGEMETRDLSTTGGAGDEHFFRLDVWGEGEGRKATLEIAARVKALLDDEALALEGNAVLVSLFAIGSRSRREQKTKAYVVEMRFRAVTE